MTREHNEDKEEAESTADPPKMDNASAEAPRRLRMWQVGLSTVGAYGAWILIHVTAAHLYSHVCAPMTLGGVVRSAFAAPAPHCQLLRIGIQYGGDHISRMWTLLLSAALVAATS